MGYFLYALSLMLVAAKLFFGAQLTWFVALSPVIPAAILNIIGLVAVRWMVSAIKNR